MLNYTEKIWGIPAAEIHTDWADQRIRGLSVTSILRDVLARIFDCGNHQARSLVHNFHYPNFGSGQIYDAIKQRLLHGDCAVHTGSQPVAVHHNGTRVLQVDVLGGIAGKHSWSIYTEQLIQTIPLTAFLRLLRPAPPKEIVLAASRLRFRSQTCLFLTIDRDRVTDDQWIYFPEKDIPFGRISEMNNFSPAMSPAGKTSLFVEFFCFAGDELWSLPAEILYDRAIGHLERLGFVRRHEVRAFYRIRAANVYPIYDLHYRESLDRALTYLDGFENLHCIGRQGRFRYNNQDQSLEMGLAAARSILSISGYSNPQAEKDPGQAA